jgi:thiazole synthase
MYRQFEKPMFVICENPNSTDAALMAEAMRDAVIAGRKSYLAGRMLKRLYASASSPLSEVVR